MIFFHFIYILILSFYFCFYSSMECEILLWSYTIHLPKGDNSMITNITKFFHRWSFSMGDRGHMKLSPIGKSSIRRTYLFDITVVAIMNVIHLIMETVPKKVLPLILWSFTFTTEIGSYIWPKLKDIFHLCQNFYIFYPHSATLLFHKKQNFSFMEAIPDLHVRVSEWLMFNANSAIFQLSYGENKLIFNEMMMRSSL